MEWLICMAIGAALWLAIPVVRNVEHRRTEPHPMLVPIAAAVRIPDPDPELDALARAADCAIEAQAERLAGAAQAMSRGLQ